MANHASVLGYFWQAGMIVKFVMMLLLVTSITSWTLILQRAWYFKRKKIQIDTKKSLQLEWCKLF